MLSMAFVPVCDQRPVFRELYDDLPDEMLPVATYFEENYLFGRRGRGRRAAVAPRFPPQFWNTYEATLQDQHRTNNFSEGWHSKFQQAVGKHHTSLYSALQELIKEQEDTETILQQLDLRQNVKAAPTPKWSKVPDRIRRVVAATTPTKRRTTF